MCDVIPDLEYRAFMLKLARQLSADDTEELKYMLKSLIPAGKREKLEKTWQVFDHLENLLIVGPRNLNRLRDLLQSMEKHKQYAMVVNFIRSTGEVNYGYLAELPE